MSRPLDPSRCPDLPPEVAAAFAAARFELSAERAARRHEQAVVAEKEAFITELEALEGQIRQHRRAKFGPKSEKLDSAQLDLALEGETLFAIGSITMVERDRHRRDPNHGKPRRASPRSRRRSPPARATPRRLPRANRARPGRRPRRLPQVKRVIEPDGIDWSPLERHRSERRWRRGCGDMVRIGEDRARRLDCIPARHQVIVTIRHSCACPKGRGAAGEGPGASAGRGEQVAATGSRRPANGRPRRCSRSSRSPGAPSTCR